MLTGFLGFLFNVSFMLALALTSMMARGRHFYLIKPLVLLGAAGMRRMGGR